MDDQRRGRVADAAEVMVAGQDPFPAPGEAGARAAAAVVAGFAQPAPVEIRGAAGAAQRELDLACGGHEDRRVFSSAVRRCAVWERPSYTATDAALLRAWKPPVISGIIIGDFHHKIKAFCRPSRARAGSDRDPSSALPRRPLPRPRRPRYTAQRGAVPFLRPFPALGEEPMSEDERLGVLDKLRFVVIDVFESDSGSVWSRPSSSVPPGARWLCGCRRGASCSAGSPRLCWSSRSATSVSDRHFSR